MRCVVPVFVVALSLSRAAAARDWSLGPERLTYEVGVVGLAAYDELVDEQQLGGFFGARVHRWGPLTLELMAFGGGGTSGDPDVAGEMGESHTLLALIPGIGVEVARGPTTFGVGLFCRPPFVVIMPDHGADTVRRPALSRSFFRVPNVSLIMGDDRYFIELGGGGDPTPLEPRLGYVSYQWRDPDGSGTGGALGLAALGVLQSDGAARGTAVGIAAHGSAWIAIGKDFMLALRADVSSVVVIGMSFVYVTRPAQAEAAPNPDAQ